MKAPIWVSLCDLPVEYMHPEGLYSIARAIGKSLKVDTLTLNMLRPSVARLCVEVDLTKDFPRSVKIVKKGKKHEQQFTYEHIPSYCSKCCKIGHKEEDCRIGKPHLQKESSRKDAIPVIKSKGVKQALKMREDVDKSGFDVQILQSNPLKGVESQYLRMQKSESVPSQAAKTLVPHHPAKTLAAGAHAETPVVRLGESTSGLSAMEKLVIPVDFPDEVSPPSAVSNHFAVLETIDESENENVDDAGEDHVEDVFIKDLTLGLDPLERSKPADASQPFEEAQMTIQQLGSGDILEVGRSTDDGEIGKSSGPKEIEESARNVWFDGDNDDARVEDSVQGEESVLKKHGLYAKTTRVARQSLWRNSIDFRHQTSCSPWMVAGEFNVIRSLEEYSGVSVQDHGAMWEFNECIYDCDLIEIPATGEDFTWGGTRSTGWERRVRQSLFKIQAPDGSMLTSRDGIEQEAVRFFKDLLNDPSDDQGCDATQEDFLEHIPLTLTQDDTWLLSKPITLEEIKEAVFNLGEESALRIDGYGGVFYRSDWT
ncbi:OLC1v1016196C1 [Oldenlandia corymbosa var. corymbosa]|uniref:OLC1v1016196C1 n=1 Tax=Oldenlandia corymbosa var. corymbosa TaxID=529605 RepID=A0AAV1E6L6_OLDCO|nr:OLC1v1016196C1 [Oldenlandia corymbosa var. corymbosa]